ncbi:proteasome accessory factor PafA2 family protein [Candidatus Woesearchaeota archaeon]|nr:proteasome accessory factor PafA2 family protein [Candidatus Woesearchaeota archaeon]
MAIPKIMGTETEYGLQLFHPREAPFHYPSELASIVVDYVAKTAGGQFVQWAYEFENQQDLLRDFAGVTNSHAHRPLRELPPVRRPWPSDDFISAVRQDHRRDVLLPNGARAYPDHAHPEYSTPECMTVHELIAQEKAGERIMELARKEMMRVYKEAFVDCADDLELLLYKMNVDSFGNSFGAHENYFVDRKAQSPLQLMHELVPHLVTRIIYCGSGDIKGDHFEISQRACHFSELHGLQTTHDRPVFNTRDEPHADAEKYIRLHVICGDANMSEVSLLMKMGFTRLVLELIEDRVLDVNKVALQDPVSAFHEISQDLELSCLYRMADDRQLTAINIQELYLDAAQKHFGSDGTDEQKMYVREWERALDLLKNDRGKLTRDVDWLLKYDLLDKYRARHHCPWDAQPMRLLALRYHDIQESGNYNRLVSKGVPRRVVTEEDIQRAMMSPPEDTRAYARAGIAKRFPHAIRCVNWEGVVGMNGESLLFNPQNGTKKQVGATLDSATSFSQLVKEVSS